SIFIVMQNQEAFSEVKENSKFYLSGWRCHYRALIQIYVNALDLDQQMLPAH
ncbi:hypothetical protein SK128_027839, partial [Halocaridina rubra]